MITPIELTRKGFKSLVNTLGYVDAVRFLHQFDNESGDYTQERYQWLDNLSQNDILADIQQRQKTQITDEK
ncbi:MAG: hypothetical protein ACRC2R_12190 [Xenococcaceae cyanobacterium]